ncbi:MAG: ABC transporter permease [Pseudomonadota bacterium]
MNGILTVFKKEFIDNLRDRRTLLSALIFGPLFGPLIFAFVISFTLKQAISEPDKVIELPVIGAELAPNLVQFLKQNNVDVIDPPADPEYAVKERLYDVIIEIPEDFGAKLKVGEPAALRLISDQSNRNASKSQGRIRSLINGYNRKIGLLRLQVRGINPSVVNPIVIEDVDLSTPVGRSLILLGMVTYFLFFATLMGGMYLAIDATAGERERGSLEPLLTLPVSRANIMFGKLSATCVFMMMSLALTLIAFFVSLRFIPLEQLGMSANTDMSVGIKIFFVMLPFVVFGAGLLTLVASFTKSYKEAQSYLSLVLLVPTLPIMVAAIMLLKPTLALMTVPSLSQHLVITELMKGEPLSMEFTLVSVACTLAVGLLLSFAAARLYGREGILG